MPDGVVETLFTPAYALVRLEHGTTEIAEQQWASAWYELVRREQSAREGCVIISSHVSGGAPRAWPG